MKRTILNITIASAITLIAYIVLYAVWGAILNGIENPTAKLLCIALMTTFAFDLILLYIAKIRNGVGEDEVTADYEKAPYISVINDFEYVIKREAKTLITIAVIIIACFALNKLDVLIFGEKTFSFVTLIFVALCIFSSVFSIELIGYLLGCIAVCALYILILLIYRRKTYKAIMKN